MHYCNGICISLLPYIHIAWVRSQLAMIFSLNSHIPATITSHDTNIHSSHIETIVVTEGDTVVPSEGNPLLCLKDLRSHITNGLTCEVSDTDTRPLGLGDPESVLSISRNGNKWTLAAMVLNERFNLQCRSC